MSRRSKRAAPAPPPQAPLEGCHIAVSGSFANLTHTEIYARIKALGATAAEKTVTKSVTHLVTTDRECDDAVFPSAKLSAAKRHGASIVSLGWLEACETAQAREPEDPYQFNSNATPGPAGGAPAQPTQPAAPVSKPALKRAASSTNAAQSKKKKAMSNDVDEEEDEDDVQAAPAQVLVRRTTKSQIAKDQGGFAPPVDEYCPLVTHKVYIDPDGFIFDASLNQTNASKNNNKFYRIQLLHENGSYKTWTRWGRVGERGQNAILGGGSLDDAMKQFESKFKAKSGLAWANRLDNPKPGKYAFVERNFNDEQEASVISFSDKLSQAQNGSSSMGDSKAVDKEWKPPICTLAKPVQDLLQLIFNQSLFDATMSSLKYDASKLPIDKLSKSTITRGYQALKDLSALLDDASLASNYDLTPAKAIEHLSNTYYSFIPHAFGRNRPPIIDSQQMIKIEIEVLENLSGMRDAALIMKMEGVKHDVHILDRRFHGLGMEEMTPLDPKTTEFTLLKDYLVKTRGHTHGVNYKVQAIFRIERKGEHDRFKKSPFGAMAADRRLLWHGSRTTNFGGILSQGLRIAPPEAPVSGYMFDKGIYLADMSSKSANYCYASLSQNTGLLLLCEAELGKPMQSLVNASYNAGETAKKAGLSSTWGMGTTGPSLWKDASCVHPDLAGVTMPDTDIAPGATNVAGAYLQYNEYICYDIAQVRLRYLFQVKM